MGPHLEDKKKDVKLPALRATTSQQRQQQQTMTRQPSPGNARLHLSWDYAGRQSVALKTFHLASPCTLNDPHRRVIKQEVICMDRVLPHPNVVKLLAVVKVSRNEVRLVMEAAAAFHDNLMEVITAAPGGRLKNDTARFYFSQLVKVVKHCHSRGVCHRDIQPENLLVDPRSGTVKLSSFGRAGMWDPAVGDASDLSYAPCGVPLKHAAPEVAEGSKYDGKAADVWSCAVVLFNMLAGFFPSEADAAKHKTEGGCDHSDCFQAAAWIPPSARSLLESMMESDPKKRYTMAEVRSHPWFTQTRGWDSDSRDYASASKDGISSDGGRISHIRGNQNHKRPSSGSSSSSSSNSGGSEDSSSGGSTKGDFYA